MSNAEPQGCLTAILRLFGITLGQPAGEDDESGSEALGLEQLPYRLRDDFLSPAELSFYQVLRFALKDQAVVCAKVNLADIFFVSQPRDNRSAKNKIDRKHVDFLICNPETMKPLLGLELDDASHQKADRVERDRFVDAVFNAAGLSLIHITARSAYDPNALAAELAPLLGARAVASPQLLASVAAASPDCPKCGVPMVRRVASKGQNAGKQFWGCQNYPKCREVA